MHKFRPYVPASILVIGYGLLWYARAQAAVPLARPLSGILGDLQGYEAREQQLDDDERRVAGMTDYIARAYIRDDAIAFTTLVSYYDRQTRGKTIHSPRNCLPGAGWEVMRAGTRTVSVDGVPHTLNRYVLRKGRSTALAYYWYQGRGHVTANEYEVKWNLLRDAALLGHTEEALVRVVVPVAAQSGLPGRRNDAAGLENADAMAQDVAVHLISDVNEVLPRSHVRKKL